MAIEEVKWQERVTPELVQQYKRDGVVFIDQLLHPLWLQLIEMGITRVLNNSTRKQTFFAGDEGQFIDTVLLLLNETLIFLGCFLSVV